MEDVFFDAVRAVVNFARFDTQYQGLEKRRPEQLAYFNERFEVIAVENAVDPAELRTYLVKTSTRRALAWTSGVYLAARRSSVDRHRRYKPVVGLAIRRA
jgi:hypothetical protein